MQNIPKGGLLTTRHIYFNLDAATVSISSLIMWRRVYLHVVLVSLRLYFALSPSYLHPDEHFQGPEIIAG